MHLDDAQVARLVDGEPGAGERWVHEHLAACAECRARFAQAERDAVLVERELRALDHLPPAIGAPAMADRARRAADRGRWRWAAGVLLAAGLAGGAWALPGSPLQALVRRAIGTEAPPAVPLPASGPADPAAVSGLALDPGPTLRLDFGARALGGSVAVTLVDGDEMEVLGPADAATYTAGEERLVVERTASARFLVRIPRAAPLVEIRAGSTLLFLKAGDRLTAPAAPDSTGTWLLSLP